jgi:hypothetical protein
VQRRRVAEPGEFLGHRGDRLGPHRRGGRVIQVDRPGVLVTHDCVQPSGRDDTDVTGEARECSSETAGDHGLLADVSR